MVNENNATYQGCLQADDVVADTIGYICCGSILTFTFFCFKSIIIYCYTQKQKKIKMINYG